ncbi:Thioredoxin-like fold protein [Actinidia chinensis var. chinensis]|uniref:Thioredoxin-like fold protein n=1 Tax=Actinidia chinensis var. chinensis TaxID=1590841 RepID=A0A2R6PWE2_ACTCC|nr:Thioredoxin-like fold protein [Actinidia chinensis var. chinensis]
MKTMKGKLLKKLKSIKPIGYLKPDRILQVYASDGFSENFLGKSSVKVETEKIRKEEEPNQVQSILTVQEPEIIDVSELMRDLDDDEEHNKENMRPETEVSSHLKPKIGKSEFPESRNGNSKNTPLLEIDVANFRRPDLNSGSLFDPNLLAAFKQAVMEIKAQEEVRRERIKQPNRKSIEGDEEPPLKAQKIEEENRVSLFDFEENTDPLLGFDENRDLLLETRDPLLGFEETRDPLLITRDPLLDFEEKCPPGGSDSVILYTTGLRGIRKTFEDCNSIRFLLESFRVLYFERDVSMHSEFREELWGTLGVKIVPPRLFIKGRYIGGAEAVLGLHERGELRLLLEGIPIDRSNGPCEGCAGFRFVVCFSCNGSHKAVSGDDGLSEECPECNENGLIVCPICC